MENFDDAPIQPGSIQTRTYTPIMEDELRQKLRYFFMNPCQKWRAKRKFPFKLVMQVVKIILVTAQLAMFGMTRSSHVEFLEKSNIAFKHLYLKDWNPGYETMPYPPASGAYAVYTIPHFYDAVNFALENYKKTEELAIGTYHFSAENNSMPFVEMCKTHYKKGQIWAFNQSFIFDSKHVTECIEMRPIEVYNNKTKQMEEVYDTETYLNNINQTIYFDRILSVVLKFSLKTVHLKFLSKLNSPDCYRFNIRITFDNTDHNGQMTIDLKSWETSLKCEGYITFKSDDESRIIFSSIFDVIVIIVSLVSLVLCARSIVKAHILKKETMQYYEVHLRKNLSFNDRLEFLNMWYVLIILNDCLTVAGSIIKISIENKRSHSYEVCGVLLGTGNLFVWVGVLRYLGFFEKYNVLILTMKRAVPSVLRFLICAGVFYFGFAVCGWVVLGPYHIKFRQLSTTSECLFSLVNGDDMFVTFAAISNTHSYVWWYSRIYLYIFISLFIYVILNVFISVIVDTYETLKHCYENGFPKTELHEFIDQCPDDAIGLLGRSNSNPPTCLNTCLNTCLPSCCRKGEVRPDSPNEYTSLMT